MIETRRLTLRAHTLADFSDSLSLWSDPIVTRYIGGRPFTREEVWSRLHRYAGHWALLGYGYWVVREKVSDRFVGEVGLADFQRTLEPSMDGVPEAGWVLSPASHGHGFATEAVRSILEWGEARFGNPRSACIVHPDNLASLRVADRCGYVRSCVTEYKGEPTVLLRRG